MRNENNASELKVSIFLYCQTIKVHGQFAAFGHGENLLTVDQAGGITVT